MSTRPHRLDLTGQQFGRWTVIRKNETKTPSGEILWDCLCSCGTSRTVKARGLTSGRSQSCGCYHKERVSLHGMTGTGTFKSWESMLQRCLNTKAPDYPGYGGRGIKVCNRWMASFDAFLSDMGRRPDGATLDREDVNGDYKPSNCRWATASRQQRNRRDTKSITWRGKTMPTADWADLIGVPAKVITWRLAEGWALDRAMTEPVAPRIRRG